MMIAVFAAKTIGTSMNHFSRSYILVFVLAAALMTGCATYNMTKPAPSQSKPTAIIFNTEELSGWTLPIGVYRVPNSQVIISGHQKSGGAQFLFGLIGVAVANAIDSSIGEDSTQSVANALRINLTSQAQEITRKLIDSAQFSQTFTVQEDTNAFILSVITSVAVTYVNDTDVRPYVVLKASLRESMAKEPIWTTRYIASTGKARPLIGDNSWTASDGESLKSAVSGSLKKAITFMLVDVATPHIRDDANLTMVEGHFVYVRPRLQLVGYQLAEDSESIAFIPKIPDLGTFAGIHIMDKSVMFYRPAMKEEVVFKVVDDAAK
jgi:hypothetical protein